MEDSYKSSDSSSLPQDEEITKYGPGEYRGQKQTAEPSPKGGGAYTPDEPDYEELFIRDAMRRVHDEELSALASLAVIRSGSDGRGQILTDSGAESSGHLKKPKETLEQIISELES